MLFATIETAYSDELIEGTWEWVTGEAIGFTNWHTGEPSCQNSYEDCAMLLQYNKRLKYPLRWTPLKNEADEQETTPADDMDLQISMVAELQEYKFS